MTVRVQDWRLSRYTTPVGHAGSSRHLGRGWAANKGSNRWIRSGQVIPVGKTDMHMQTVEG